jgi:phosphate transport system protein
VSPLDKEKRILFLVDIPKLSVIAKNMMRNSIDPFVRQDIELAKKVVLSDSQADKLRNLIQEELINEYLAKDPSTAPRAVPLLLIARYLERFCDHATYVAEGVAYMTEGKVVKHHHEKLSLTPAKSFNNQSLLNWNVLLPLP